MERRAYYDAEPWYQREKTQDWYQQMEKTNEAMRLALGEYFSKRLTVLEIACGGGWLAEFILKSKVSSYSGFDFSETAVSNARKRLGEFEDARIWRGDALNPQYYTKQYGLVVSHQFLHCLVGPDRVKWLSLCRKALRPEGVLVISSMIGIPPSEAGDVDSKTKLNKPGNRYYASEEEITAEIETAGMELEEVLHPEDNSAIFVIGAKIN
jgi:SAM-dependent methyltransferase